MAPSKALVIAVATIALVVQSALAANYTVGAPGGTWDLQTNFASWAASKTFVAGDNLIFTYSPQQHDVLEVSKANYDSCSSGGPIASHTSGNDVISLPAAATRYFICGIPGHCNGSSAGGMKVAITVAAGAAATPPPASSSPAPPTTPGGSPPGASPPPPSSSPPPPPSSPGAGAPASPPPPPQTPGGSSGADGRSGVRTKAAVGLGMGVLVIMLAL